MDISRVKLPHVPNGGQLVPLLVVWLILLPPVVGWDIMGGWTRAPSFLQKFKELFLLFYVELTPNICLLFSFMDHILIPHLRILTFSLGSFYQWTHSYFSISDTIQWSNIITQRIFIINTTSDTVASPTLTTHMTPSARSRSSPRSSRGSAFTRSPSR